VMGWRSVDWDAVAGGQPEAVAALVSACEAHESARRYLEEDGGALGEKLNNGLDRFYVDNVAPKLQKPDIILALTRNAGAPLAGQQTNQPSPQSIEGLSPRERPQVTVGHTVRMNTGCGHLYVTINESDDGKPFELFNHMGKAGGCAASQNEAIGRLISYALRCGARLEPLIKQLKGISCHRPAWGEDGKVSSCSDAIGKALEKYAEASLLRQARGFGTEESFGAWDDAHEGNGNGNGKAELLAERARLADPVPDDLPPVRRGHDVHRVQGACVDCGSQLSFEEGCVKCHSCGFTECG
jgi:ribonucleoside-diphosphate reductase alpha chain